VAYFAEPDGEVEKQDPPLRLLIPTWVLAGASIYFGLFSGFAVQVANLAAAQLFASGTGAGY
jgi:hypothetical protein